ncbi:hypothetical protein SAMN02745975_00312 [Geosporobacter subterraneus DSM 17957]|uniref:Uncharacterized protein n=1 Tax=Geosporobacter subterraneus DSM 17957 TaxID=1121919 RepID=A0A1M6CS04_9FIRM|nr:hypothetical protein [Geosporobacter subterraneus]SHI63875.1 hypothetical protein SAMN02745975_00312 [Geosporobacter subterraneus DSM 17957]
MIEHPKDNNQKKEKEPDVEGFMQRLSNQNVLSDALLVEVDQTDFTNVLIAEQSIQDEKDDTEDQT